MTEQEQLKRIPIKQTLMNALKEVNLISEDCIDEDVLYDFRHYICRVSFYDYSEVVIQYEPILDIIEGSLLGGDDYERANISIIGIPIDERKQVK